MNIRLVRNRFFLLFLLILASAFSLPGQIGRGSITGIARDPTGAAVPGASVIATNVDTGVTYEAATNETGSYTISALPTGQYRVRFTATGFKEFMRENISLEAGTIARVDPIFEVGGVTEQVVVTAEAAMLFSLKVEPVRSGP